MNKEYSTANPLLLPLLDNPKYEVSESSEELTEAKADQQKFIDKFGQNMFDLFNKSKDRLKNAGLSTDILYHVKNTSVDDMKNILYNLRAKVNKTSNTSKQDLTKIPGKYNYLGSEKGYDVYEPLDVEASMALGVGSGWCTTGRYGHAGDLNFKPSLKDAKGHWDGYTARGVRFFYFLQEGIGKYALALYPKILTVNAIISNIYIVETNFEIYNQQDRIVYNVIPKLPIDLIKENFVLKTMDFKDGMVLSKDNKTILDVAKNITSLTIPNSVTSIDDHVFYGCSSLESIKIPNSVTAIAIYAFSNCSSLKSISVADGNPKYDSRNDCNAIIEKSSNTLIVGCSATKIPDSVTSIGVGAFEGCSSLTSIVIPNSVTSIGLGAFSKCKKLKSVTIPNTVTTIHSSAFYNCSSLTSVTIPDSVTLIERGIFEKCSSLKSVTIPDSVTSIGPIAFYKCSSLTSIVIPDGVTSIGNSAFSGCSSLVSVTIPDSIMLIESWAFNGCSLLKHVTIPNSVNKIGDSVFNRKTLIITNNEYIIDYCKKHNLKYKSLEESLVNESMNETIEKHDELNPALFDGEELKPEVKDAIQKIADEFIKNLEEDEIKAILKDIVLIGSNVNYNYNPDSDLDIHLVVDSKALECPPELVDRLYGAYRSIFNKNYDITIKGIPAEVYVELDEVKANSNGIYSINDGWIKKPEPTAVPDIDQEAFEQAFKEWEDRYFALIGIDEE